MRYQQSHRRGSVSSEESLLEENTERHSKYKILDGNNFLMQKSKENQE